jgi:hypothetical protein
MTMTDTIESQYHTQLLYVKSKVSDNILRQVKEEAKYILKNESEFKKYNKGLAGNIEKEYSVQKSSKILENEIIALANEHYKQMNKDENYPHWNLTGMWINFQKKHEHNPLHDHTGNLSFVMWVQIPYDLQEELNLANSKTSNAPSNSLFSFVYTDVFGQIAVNNLRVDKSYEGTIIIFKSNLRHMVYPFHTSDDYRISISGNLIAGTHLKTVTPFAESTTTNKYPKTNMFSYK